MFWMQGRESAVSRSGSTPTAALTFCVYGYRFELAGNCDFARDGLAEDFGFFADHRGTQGETEEDPAGRVSMELVEGAPDYDGLPVCDASVYTPRNVVYRHQGLRIIDFGGRGLALHYPEQRRFRMVSEDPHLVYEAGYLFLLSQIGEALDARGLHRLHALAMSYKGRAILVLLPTGGGKSTLGNSLLKRKELSILSDDSPFIDRRGNALAFPLRIGMLQGGENDIPKEYCRLIHRMEFGPKYSVNYSYFAHRVLERAKPGLVLLGRRTLARVGRVERASYRTAMQAMLPNMIVGVGLYQGLEYLLERSTLELAGKTGLAVSRSRNAHALVRSSKTFLFHMGQDVEANAQIVMDLAAKVLRC